MTRDNLFIDLRDILTDETLDDFLQTSYFIAGKTANTYLLTPVTGSLCLMCLRKRLQSSAVTGTADYRSLRQRDTAVVRSLIDQFRPRGADKIFEFNVGTKNCELLFVHHILPVPGCSGCEGVTPNSHAKQAH